MVRARMPNIIICGAVMIMPFLRGPVVAEARMRAITP